MVDCFSQIDDDRSLAGESIIFGGGSTSKYKSRSQRNVLERDCMTFSMMQKNNRKRLPSVPSVSSEASKDSLKAHLLRAQSSSNGCSRESSNKTRQLLKNGAKTIELEIGIVD